MTPPKRQFQVFIVRNVSIDCQVGRVDTTRCYHAIVSNEINRERMSLRVPYDFEDGVWASECMFFEHLLVCRRIARVERDGAVLFSSL